MSESTPNADSAGSGSPAPAPVPGTPVYRRNQKKLCESLIVVVHGMGDQSRNDLAQTVGHLFARQAAKRAPTQATRLPLGLWDAGKTAVDDHAIGFVSVDRSSWLEKFAFAEVYWADLPRELEKQGHRLQESKRWAATVVERLAQRHALTKEFGEDGPRLAATVIEEITETIRILERLLWLADRAGIVDFQLAQILESYLADVQQVADFRGQRASILQRFLERMAALAKDCPKADIHIIAHSEGSVVAFLGLLTALWDESEFPEAAPHLFDIERLDMSWISRVRSFSTLGSPIDKHLIFFPEMWFRFSSKRGNWRKLDPPIRWRNYYDLGDPVGFNLDTSRLQLKSWGCTAFDFEANVHDHGFRRYLFPGKAHVDYFGDDDVFRHIIDDAVEGKNLAITEKPRSRFRGRMGRYLPFVVVVFLHVAAVFLFHKALLGDPGEAATNPGNPRNGSEITSRNLFAPHHDPLPRYSLRGGGEETNDEVISEPLPTNSVLAASIESTIGILGCSALLLGVTVLTRTWHIARRKADRIFGLVVFVVGAVIFCKWPGVYTLEVVSRVTPEWVIGLGISTDAADRVLFVAFALFAFVVAALADYLQLRNDHSPIWGLRWMIIVGGVPPCAILVIPRLVDANTAMSSIISLAGAAAFLYLWWLGAIVFDLAYCWARYISTANSLLTRVRPHLLAAERLDEVENE